MRDLIKLTCENCGRANYYTSKNKRTMPEKFSIKKYCAACRSHKAHRQDQQGLRPGRQRITARTARSNPWRAAS